MAGSCQLCGKGSLTGHKVSFSKQRSQKISKPNLHKVGFLIDGKKKQMVLCTKCIRVSRKKYQVAAPKK